MTLRALYVDFNSYFASVEQQLVPSLRGKPVAVLPVMAETTCCIAASYEAKAYGVKTGTKVREARQLCPGLIFVEARPPLYVEYHHKLVEIVESCTHVDRTLSIDEMVCELTGSQQLRENALHLATHIKNMIASKAGEFIRCSIGIAPNTFLAKVASNMQKPDGCVVIEAAQLPQILYPLKLSQLNGIGRRMEARLNAQGIHSIEQLYSLNRQQLRAAWGSVDGERMYDKLHGIVLDVKNSSRKSLGHSHVLPPEMRFKNAALAILHRLLQKACTRLRAYDLFASTMHVRVKFIGKPSWVTESSFSASNDTLMLTHILEQLWLTYPAEKLTPYAVGIVFTSLQPQIQSIDMFDNRNPRNTRQLAKVLDNLNMRFGKNTVYFGGAHQAINNAPMRIAFNHIPSLDI